MAHERCSGSKATLTGQRIAAAPGPLPGHGCHCCARTAQSALADRSRRFRGAAATVLWQQRHGPLVLLLQNKPVHLVLPPALLAEPRDDA
ncbi:hypothetical protein ACFY4K_34920 [Streptomyces leeuwenhoekii]|uniref:hypothetical protein n=1 Tax=Streptomyces leeuwenhoekii TaxID=1437453 RepID=UPI00368789AF